MNPEMLPLVFAAFAAGLLGSTHCLAMCGGISGLFAAGETQLDGGSRLRLAVAYNTGRVLTYAVFGFLVAIAGQAAVGLLPALAAPVRIASGLIIVLVGLQVAYGLRLLGPLERVGAAIWSAIAPRARRLLPATTVGRALSLGLAWGWLPCGLVYSALLLAATSANAILGGVTMIAFGIGTMPAMIASGLGALRLSELVSRNRLGAGWLIVILGLLTLALPVLTTLGIIGSHGGHASHSTLL